MSTFTFAPAPGATETTTPRVRTAQFGDGYAQRVADGINTRPRAWSVTFNRLTSDINAIVAFLEARNGVESFDWAPPTGAAGKWLCKSWSRNIQDRVVHSVSAMFEEVFGE